jgi:hypothetical protein
MEFNLSPFTAIKHLVGSFTRGIRLAVHRFAHTRQAIHQPWGEFVLAKMFISFSMPSLSRLLCFTYGLFCVIDAITVTRTFEIMSQL